MFRYKFWYNLFCLQKDLLIASVVADYVIAGDARNFAIKKAIQMSKFAVAPYAAEAGRMEANAM